MIPESWNVADSRPRVLVFDSGVGGLSIAGAIDEVLGDWQLLYLADNAFFPYGDQPEEQVIRRCADLVAAAVERFPVDFIVIGCNTASTVVLPTLRARFECPVIGVVPAIKPAAALTRNHRIGLLATPATVRRPYLDKLIQEFAGDAQITRIGSTELVRLAENWMQTQHIGVETLTAILAPFRRAEVDTVVLGCTHFPLIGHLLKPILDPDVAWVDSGHAIGRRLLQLWREKDRHRGGTQGSGRTAALTGSGPGAEAVFMFSGRPPEGLETYLARNGWAPPILHGGFSPATSCVR